MTNYQHPLRHNEFWTVEEETQLKELMRQEMTIREVAETMERKLTKEADLQIKYS